MTTDRLSEEAKLAIKTLENERDEAVAAGITDDWWIRKFESLITASLFHLHFKVYPEEY